MTGESETTVSGPY